MFETYYTALEIILNQMINHMIGHVMGHHESYGMSHTFDFCSGRIVASKVSYIGIYTRSFLCSHTFWNSIGTLLRTTWPVRPFRPISHSSSFTFERIEDLIRTDTVWSAITLEFVFVKCPLWPTTKSVTRGTSCTTATYWTTLKIFEFGTPKWIWTRLIFIIRLKLDEIAKFPSISFILNWFHDPKWPQRTKR